VQEQQPLAAGNVGAGIHLRSAAAVGPKKSQATVAGRGLLDDLSGAVDTAAVDHTDFELTGLGENGVEGRG